MIVWLKKFLNGKMPVLFHDYYIIYLKKKNNRRITMQNKILYK